MKLFIWEGAGVLTDYTDGMIFAIAPDLETAHRLIDEKYRAMMKLHRPDITLRDEYPDTPTKIIDLSKTKITPEAWFCEGGG